MSPIPGIIASSQTGGLVTGAFESIATATGSGSSSTITFSSIPSGYQHLQIRYIGKSTTTTSNVTNFTLKFNSDGGSNYAYHGLRGTGAAVGSASSTSQTIMVSQYASIPQSNVAIADMHGVGIIDIQDYLSTSKNKTVRIFQGSDLNRTSAPVGQIAHSSGLWFKTPEAITQIDLVVQSGSWTTTSQFALYGIKGA